MRHPALGVWIAIAISIVPGIAGAGSGALPADKAQAEVVKFLQDLVRIDTQDPPGNETRIASYIRTALAAAGIDAELIEPVAGRASVVARLTGDGSKRPLLLMGHEDVVPVDRPHWTVEPFAAVVRDGAVWGRGASDDKASVAANLEVMLQLKRSKAHLKRDVIFLAEASEEASSTAGMAMLIERYWDRIDCEFALNEGGNSLVSDGRIIYMGVATAEKLPRGLHLVANGSSGHGSVPRVDNAVVHLAAAVVKAGTWETPSRLNETTLEFFRRLSDIAPPEEAAWYRNLLDPAVQAQLRVAKPSYYSMLRTSVVPTMLEGGIKENVIPPTAEATLDVRALPDEGLEQFRVLLAQQIDDPQVKVVPTGATDSSFLRAKGVAAYGVGVPKTEQESRGVHGNDERITVAHLALFERYLLRAVTLVAE